MKENLYFGKVEPIHYRGIYKKIVSALETITKKDTVRRDLKAWNIREEWPGH